MTNLKYDLWTLTECRIDDPRDYLETIVLNAKFDKVQAIKYKDEMVFVISEKQYQKLINSWGLYV